MGSQGPGSGATAQSLLSGFSVTHAQFQLYPWMGIEERCPLHKAPQGRTNPGILFVPVGSVGGVSGKGRASAFVSLGGK